MSFNRYYSHKCLKLSFGLICFIAALAVNGVYFIHWSSLKEYNERYKIATKNCERNINSKLRINTRLVKSFKSYPCEKNLYVKKCGTCAYVTGSGHLLGSKKGKEIDSYDCVFRSNSAPIVGYEEDVGTRTDFRTMNHLSVRDMLEQLETNGVEGFDLNTPNHTIFLGYQVTWHGEDPEIIKILPEMKNLSFYIVEDYKLNETLQLFHKDVGPTTFTLWMSNGFISIQIMKDFCDEIHVYGIADDKRCEKVNEGVYDDAPYHYYGFLGKLETECWRFWRHGNGYWGHQYNKEKSVFRQWYNNWNNLYFHQPEWT